MRAFGKYLALVIVSLFVVAAVLKGSIPQVATGGWQPADQMSQARTGATSVLLPDGRILIAGGSAPDGTVLSSAEFFNPDGTFSAAPPMGVARTGQAAVWMPIGEMLVTGGTTTGGGVTNSAEVFNPQTNTWQTLSTTLVDARTGQTMVLLQSGDVLIVGGAGSASPVSAIELFSAKTQQFAFVAQLATARTNAAAALLSDGRVFIVGGTSANGATLASSEIYDPSNPGATTAGPALKTPRSGASATTMLHGNVLIAGGSYPEGAQKGPAELASAEIFDPVAGTMIAVKSAMSAARTGQLAFLLPSNNNVLLVGGTYNGQPLASTELYSPWKGKFKATGTMASARAGAVGSAMNSASYGAPYTVTGIDGLLLVAGGSNLSSAELYGFATIRTNAGDYAPGTPVIMTGSGWKPGEKVTLYLHEDPQVETNPVLTTTADANGNINDSAYAPDLKDLGIRYYMTAVGSGSGLQAQTTFTDSGKVNIGFTGNGYIYGNASSPAKIYCSNPANTPATLTGYTYNCSPTAHGSAGNTWTAVPAGGYSMGTWSFSPAASITSGCTSGDTTCVFNVNTTTALTVTFTLTAPTLTSISPTSATYGAAATLLTATGTNFVNGTSVINFNGTDLTTTCGSSTSCTATIPAASLKVTPAGLPVYVHNGTSNSGNQTFTLNKAALTITASAQSKTYGTALTLGTTAFTTTGLATGDTVTGVTLTSTGAAATAAVSGSPYTITPSAAVFGVGSASDYTITYATGNLTVNTAALTVTASAQSKTYGQTVTFGSGSTLFTSSGLQNSETIGSVTLAVSGSGGAATAAVGSYTITPSVATGGTFTASNYNITYTAGALTVNAAALTITANGDSKTYGQTKTYGAGSTAFGTGSGQLVNSDSISSVTITDTNSGGLATAAANGSYALTPSAAVFSHGTASNYNITYTAGALTVNTAALTITANNDSKTYGQTRTYGAGSGAFSTGSGQLVNSDSISSVTVTDTNSGGVATAAANGSYALTPSAAVFSHGTASNYKITYTAGALTVNTAALTITANGDSKTYGQTKTYGAGSTAFGTGSGQLVNSDSISSVTVTDTNSGGVATAAANGTYALTPSAAVFSHGTASNYNITYTAGALTVNQAVLTITANGDSKTYGQTKTYGAGSGAFSTGSGQLVNSDSISSVTITDTNSGGLATAAANGTYALTPSAAVFSHGTASNYKITYTAGALTVNTAALTITANGDSKTYGQTKTYGAGSGAFSTGSGQLVNSDSISSVTITDTNSGGLATAAANGIYALTPSAAVFSHGTASNYTITYTAGVLTVNQAPVTATAGSYSGQYDGSAHAPSACVVSGPYTGNLSCTNSPTPVGPDVSSGTITPSVTGTGVSNFAITSVPGSFNITQASSSVTISCPASVTYSGGAQSPCTATATGVGGLSQSLTVTYGNNIIVGTATASASFGGDTDHTGSSNSTTFFITQAAVTPIIVPASLNQTYSGSPEVVTVVSPVGYAVTYTSTPDPTVYPTSTTGPTNPGSYSVLVQVTDPNYVGSASGTLTISQLNPALNLALQTGAPTSTPYGTTVYFELATANSVVCPTGTVNFYVDYSGSGSPSAAQVTLNNSATPPNCNTPIQFQTASLTVGPPHSITAIYGGDTYYQGATSNALSYTVTADGTGVTLATSGTSINVGDTLTLTATVTPSTTLGGGASAPAGTVNFNSVDGSGNLLSTIGSAPLTGTTAVYSTSSLAAATYNVQAVFVDSDGQFQGSSTVVPLGVTVNLKVPVITWTPNVATIVYGTALGADQLNATAADPENSSTNVPGIFTYVPASGSVEGFGNPNLQVSFAPTDGTTYAPNTASTTITVTPATLTVTAPNLTVNYGDPVPTTITPIITGFVNGDGPSVVTTQPTCTTTYTLGNNAGSPQTTSCSGGVANNNYVFTYVSGSVTVSAATLTVTADNQTSTYGSGIPPLTFQYGPFVNGDTVASVTTAPTCSTTATSSSPVATYDITCSGGAAANYNFNYVKGTLTINPVSLVIVAWPRGKFYGQTFTFAGTEFSAFGLLNGDSVSSVTLTSNGAVATAPAGLYPITASAAQGTGLGNYAISYTGATLTVNKARPVITWTPAAASISYGVPLDATILNATASVPGTFVYSPAAGSMLAGGSHTLTVTFTPNDATNYITTVSSVPLQINPATPTIVWGPLAAINYGTGLGGAQLNAKATLNGSTVGGTYVYTLQPAGTVVSTGTVLPAGAQTLSVAFTPTSTLAADYTTATGTVTLQVNQAAPKITWPNQAAITYGTPLGATQLSATASVPGTFVYSPAAGAVLTAGAQTLSVSFTPNDADYATATATTPITVNKAAPTITWATPAAIPYGTPLGVTQLSATASVPGTFAYSPAAGAVLAGGSQKLSVTFTPNDATDYTTATGSVMLTVSPATPTITWGPLAAINYGTALGSTQLNAKATLNGATVSGTYVYTQQPAGTVVSTGTVLPAGQQNLSVTFTPTLPADYTTVTGSVTLQINQVAPKLTWANPAAITYGTPLSATQLNATASVPGMLTYTPAVGALLPIGTQTLSVSFTPNDTTDYTTVTATATITVNKARPVITWAQPAAITYGTPLSATQLSATASVGGTFTYSAAVGAVLAGGSQTLIAYFTPTDTTDYIATMASVTLQINPAAPTIVWATPAPINNGTPLGGAQLNAKATLGSSTVGGTYVYTQQPSGTVVSTGTVLPSGVQNLSVTFTPTLTADYTTATGSVQLQIN